jgi:hypothetical protein
MSATGAVCKMRRNLIDLRKYEVVATPLIDTMIKAIVIDDAING